MKTTPCKTCRAPVLFFQKAEQIALGRSKWAIVDAAPLDPHRQHDGRKVRVIDNNRAYTIGHVREHLQLQGAVLAKPGDTSRIEDLPWYRHHDCPNRR